VIALVPAAGIGKPHDNPFTKQAKKLVSKIAVESDLKRSLSKSVEAIGGLGKVITKGENVLVKPNYNSSDPPPASTDPEFLRAVVDILFEHGAGRVVVGESSMQTTSTRKTMTKTRTLQKLEDSGAEIAFFDEEEWTKIHVGGEYLENVSLANTALQVDKVVYCCCMKTHFRADFSLSLKLAFGFTKGSERLGFHIRYLKEKLVDLNLVVHPDLIFMDGRKCFISGGPFSGEVREPNLILASGDRVALDVESIKVIGSFEGSKLASDPWSYTQIQRAAKLPLGIKGPNEYTVLSN
jgi:uncharacterized protein (DUF362 family)